MPFPIVGALAGASAGLASGALTIPVIGGAAAAGGALSHLGAAGISAAGGVYGNYASARQARLDRAFQGYYSSNAHQIQVADLRRAGLNPILSARYGGASTPGGATARQVDPLTPAVQAGMAARLNKAQTYLTRDQAKFTQAEERRSQKTASREATQALLNRALESSAKQNRKNLRIQEDILNYQAEREGYATSVARERLGGDLHEAIAWSGDIGDARRYTDLVSGGKGAAGIIEAINPLKWLLRGSGK